MYELKHSAKGTHWSKKDHKYVKKENGRYYYKDDMKQKQIDEKTTDDVDKFIEDEARERAENQLRELWKSAGRDWDSERQSQVRKERYGDAYERQLQTTINSYKNTIREELGAKQNKKTTNDAAKWSEFLAKKEQQKQQKKAVDSAITKAKDALNSSKAVKAAKSVAKAYAEVKNEKVKREDTKKLEQIQMQNAVKRVGETKIMASPEDRVRGKDMIKANATAQKGRLNRKEPTTLYEKSMKNDADKRYYE